MTLLTIDQAFAENNKAEQYTVREDEDGKSCTEPRHRILDDVTTMGCSTKEWEWDPCDDLRAWRHWPEGGRPWDPCWDYMWDRLRPACQESYCPL